MLFRKVLHCITASNCILENEIGASYDCDVSTCSTFISDLFTYYFIVNRIWDKHFFGLNSSEMHFHCFVVHNAGKFSANLYIYVSHIVQSNV